MPDKFIIAPSLLSADFSCLGGEVDAVMQAGADWVHMDVMDNHYVPNLTMGAMVCKSLKEYWHKHTGKNLMVDVHLMVQPVDSMVEAFAAAGADLITFHPEASLHVDRSLSLIKKHGIKAGLALNPATSLSCLDYVLDKLDMILLMSVNPGFGGQAFMPGTLAKITQVRQLIDKSGRDIILEVDGGINIDNIASLAKHGATAFVAGNSIFASDNYAHTVRLMREQLLNT